MTDSQIIQGLHNLSMKLINEMRFAEAEFVDQAIARIMSIPAAVTKLYPRSAWQDELDQVIGYIAGQNG